MSDPDQFVDPIVEVPDTATVDSLALMHVTAEGVATVTINRPDKKNAFNAEVIAALREAFETLRGQEGVRIVFLEGSGGSFSAGADLEWMRDAAEHTEADNRDDAMQMAIMLKHLYDLPALTVALVDGGAFGGGAGLAAACDLAIATKDAKFAFSEVKLGLIPATISPYVVAAIGPRRARGLFATGRMFDAGYAREIGLVDEVVPTSAALADAKARLAREIMACAPDAVDEAKRLVEFVTEHPDIDHHVMDETAKRIARIRVGAEGQEGVRAFLARTSPSWAEP
jgi:methylglutaconyl-CoA hydratase